MTTTPLLDNPATLSLERILRLRGEAFASVRHHAASVISIGSAIENLDVALQSNADCRSIDEQQHLVDAARRLSALLDGSGVAQ